MPVLLRMEDTGRARRSRSAEGAGPRDLRAAAGAARRRLQGSRLRAQRRLAQAAAAGAVREAAAARDPQDAHRPALHGGRCARRAGAERTRCRASSSTTARSRSSNRPTRTSCPSRSIARTGRIHTSYHQAVAQTGRLSSTDPNLQNIPIRRAEGRRIRQAFIAPPGYVLMAADYSQIELRIMAHLSDDPGLLSAFAEDRDVHQATAAEIFGVPLEAVNADQRRQAKTINFGLIYGMSAFGLARRLEHRSRRRPAVHRPLFRALSRREALHGRHARAGARDWATCETVYGRRLYLPEIRSRNKQLQQGAERAAINAPMQGTAADIIKRAMIDGGRLARARGRAGAADHAGARRARARSPRRPHRGSRCRHPRAHVRRPAS